MLAAISKSLENLKAVNPDTAVEAGRALASLGKGTLFDNLPTNQKVAVLEVIGTFSGCFNQKNRTSFNQVLNVVREVE